MRKSRFGAMVLFSIICHGAHAERLAPGSPLSGYQCYNLNTDVLKLTPDDLWAGKGLPPVFKGPSEDSGNLGAASGPVYVAWPLQKENGFVRTLRFAGSLDGSLRLSSDHCIETRDLRVAVRWLGMEILFNIMSILAPRHGFFGMVTTFQRISS
jgi:hypothetical protein